MRREDGTDTRHVAAAIYIYIYICDAKLREILSMKPLQRYAAQTARYTQREATANDMRREVASGVATRHVSGFVAGPHVTLCCESKMSTLSAGGMSTLEQVECYTAAVRINNIPPRICLHL